MALTGNLQDISLANLVQMLCLDQRKAMLRLKHRDIEEGLIYFADGQIVHALVGPLVGPEAIYKLLSWGEGSFKVNEPVTAPNRTVVDPWNSILMEGMRLVDEQKLVECVQPERTLSATEIEQDSNLETNLIMLLSKLEQLQAKLAQEKTQKRPVQALRVFTEIINEVAAFGEANPPHTSKHAPLMEVLSSVSEKYAATQLLRVENNRLSTNIVTQLYQRWTDDVAKRRETFMEISQGLLDVLETYFTHLMVFFNAPILATQWQETCQLFLSELKASTQKIKF